MKVNYAKTSPYSKTPQYSWRLGNFVNRPIPASGDDLRIVLDKKYEFKPDLLSYDLYGTAEYWWVFMIRNINTIRSPMFDFTAGKIIYAPTASRLQALVG